jgi:hypothetical protein
MDYPSPAEFDEMIREALRIVDGHPDQVTPEIAAYAEEMRRRLASKDYNGLAFTQDALDRLRKTTSIPPDPRPPTS